MSDKRIRTARITKAARNRAMTYKADLRANYGLLVDIYNEMEPSVAAVETPKEAAKP